ncbi:MAG: hypothetical protein ACRDPK_11265 [Carbonactinosporaceae bacterium]
MPAKKIIIWVLVTFAVYTVIASPGAAAELVHDAFNSIAAGGRSIGEFFDALVT